MDRRSEKTKATIKTTFLQLLKNQPIEKISVTEICAKSHIGRRTFYDHFADKFEVVDLLVEDYTTQFQTTIAQYAQHGFKENIELGFKFIYEHHEMFVILYQSSISKLLLKRIELLLTEMIQSKLNHAYLQQQHISESTILTFLSHAVLGIIIEIAIKRDDKYMARVDEIVQIVRPYFKIHQMHS